MGSPLTSAVAPASLRATQPVIMVIQARMGSTRLPGKVLRPLGGRPVLDWVIRAATESEVASEIVVATSTEPDDDAIADHCRAAGIRVHRGSQHDVLDRFLGAVADVDSGAVVRLTADCPLLDPALIAATVGLWRAAGGDYVSTVQPRSLPRGLDVELVTIEALRRLDSLAVNEHRVHVTSHINTHPGDFARMGLVVSPAADDLRVTLDTPDDARLLDAVVALLGDRAPSWHEVVAVIRADPALRAMNAHVVQKALEEG